MINWSKWEIIHTLESQGIVNLHTIVITEEQHVNPVNNDESESDHRRIHYPPIFLSFQAWIDMNLKISNFPRRRKCISPKFRETAIPPKEAFYNRFKNEHISDSDYEHAQTVWNTLNMKFVGGYHDVYLLTDVLLLTDVFERFRTMTVFWGFSFLIWYTIEGFYNERYNWFCFPTLVSI
jgi:hypothetical protein